MIESISFYISITTGLLLTISEMLPYIKKIKSNGIVEYITDKLYKKSQNEHVLIEDNSVDDLHIDLEHEISLLKANVNKLQLARLIINESSIDNKITIIIESPQ